VAASEPTAPTPNPNLFRRRKPEPTLAPHREWEDFYAWFAKTWKQDEHISIIGPTGTGKSTLAIELLKIRTWKIVLLTKPEDDKLEAALLRQHYVKVGAFPSDPPDDIKRYLLWPSASGSMGAEARDRERAVIRDAFTKVFEGPKGGKPGRWCFYLDEARYVADASFLGLMRETKQMLIQGRSLRIAMVLSFQRPSWVPPEAYDQASYLFIAADNDRRNRDRFREIGGTDGEQVAYTVNHLDQYEWLFIDARPGKGDQYIVKMPKGL
jgi:hypothetical protein